MIGFYLGWFALPVEWVDVTPADLEIEYQDDYLRLIASTYMVEQDLSKTSGRIGSLGRADWADWLLQETLDEILTDPTSTEAAHMVHLATAMGLQSPAFDQVITSAEALLSPTEVSE